jgi:hypothetical protein
MKTVAESTSHPHTLLDLAVDCLPLGIGDAMPGSGCDLVHPNKLNSSRINVVNRPLIFVTPGDPVLSHPDAAGNPMRLAGSATLHPTLQALPALIPVPPAKRRPCLDVALLFRPDHETLKPLGRTRRFP